jgi:hypothetical protein
VLQLLEIASPSMSTPVRVVGDTRDLVSNGVTYIGLPFTVGLPSDKAGEVPRAKLVVDNVGRDLTGVLEALPPGAVLTATIKVVHRSTPDVVDYQFVAPMNGVRVDMGRLSATMGPDDLMRRPAVLLRFDPTNSPALFPD